MSSTARLCFVSFLSAAAISLALTGETRSQNPGGRFGFGGPLGAAGGLGPPALRGGMGGGIGPQGGGGLGAPSSGMSGSAVVVPPGMAAGTFNSATASAPGPSTPAGPALSSSSGVARLMRSRAAAVRTRGRSRMRRRKNSTAGPGVRCNGQAIKWKASHLQRVLDKARVCDRREEPLSANMGLQAGCCCKPLILLSSGIRPGEPDGAVI